MQAFEKGSSTPNIQNQNKSVRLLVFCVLVRVECCTKRKFQTQKFFPFFSFLFRLNDFLPLSVDSSIKFHPKERVSEKMVQSI